jgi:DNA-directed RNA polymerase subunit E'/Rpb7
MDIYSIEKALGDGMMRPEDNTGSAFYNVNFKAKLCNPMENTTIVGRVEDINKQIICAKNGPIVIIIDGNDINSNKFRYNNNKYAFFPLNDEGKEINTPINTGTYINVRIRRKRMTAKDTKIIVLGSLESLATPEQIKDNIKSENSSNDDPIPLEDILERDTETSDATTGNTVQQHKNTKKGTKSPDVSSDSESISDDESESELDTITELQ